MKRKLPCTTYYCDLTGGYTGNDSVVINEAEPVFAEYFDPTLVYLTIND